jgi:hypothetical protein
MRLEEFGRPPKECAQLCKMSLRSIPASMDAGKAARIDAAVDSCGHGVAIGLTGPRTQVGTVLVPDEARAKEAEALKSRDPRTSEAFRFIVEKVPIGVVATPRRPCRENLRDR